MEKSQFNYKMLKEHLIENDFKKLGSNAKELILAAVEKMIELEEEKKLKK